MYDVTCCTPRIQRVSTQPVDSASIVRNIASLCLRMQVVFNIPITTIDEIFASLNAVDSVTQMYSFQAVERSLKDCGITSQCVIQSVHDTFCHENIFSRCISQNRTGFAGLLSTHKRRAAFYKCNFPFVPPVEYKLGIKFGKRRTFQYIYVLYTLQQLLARPDVLKEVLEPAEAVVGRYATYEDGSYSRNNKLFSSNDLTIKIGLYYDDWESENPLGTSRKKTQIKCIYWTLHNLPPQHRTSLNAV